MSQDQEADSVPNGGSARPAEAPVSEGRPPDVDAGPTPRTGGSQPQTSTPTEVPSSPSGLDYNQVVSAINSASEEGMFPLLAYGLDKAGKPTTVLLVTSTINDMVLARDLLLRSLPPDYDFVGYVSWARLEAFARDHWRVVRQKEVYLPGFDATRDAAQLGRIIRDLTAAHWARKAFALVDICGFSRASPGEQLAYRTSLSVAIGQAAARVQKLHHTGYLPGQAQFCSSSTGDGFYLWHRFPGGANDVDVFMLLLYLMTSSEAMRTAAKSSMRLRGAYAIGEAYTFPARTLSTAWTRTSVVQEAIGPVLNDLARLVDKAVPGQILIGEFEQLGRSANEPLTPAALIEQASRELLPAELTPSDSVKPQHFSLRFEPVERLRISNKHQFVHYCYNLVGSSPNRFSGEQVRVQPIGVSPEKAHEFSIMLFREAQ